METQTRDNASTASSKGRRKMIKSGFFRDVLEPLLRDNAGEELLGDSDPLLGFELFQKYSTDWPSFAEVHKVEAMNVCNEFLDEIIGFVWPEYMHRGLRSILLDAQIQRRIAGAEAEIKRIFDDRERYLKTYDPEYVERLSKWREEQATNPTYKYSLEEKYLQKMLVYCSVSSAVMISWSGARAATTHICFHSEKEWAGTVSTSTSVGPVHRRVPGLECRCLLGDCQSTSTRGTLIRSHVEFLASYSSPAKPSSTMSLFKSLSAISFTI